MKEYFAAHRTFVIATGALLAVSLVLLLGVALPARSAAGQATEEADRLSRALKSSEGEALSGTARRQLEGEVEALKARVAELEKTVKPPPAPAGADKVTYGNLLAELGSALDKAAADQGIIIENEMVFPKNPEEDLPLYVTKIGIARSVLKSAVAAGIRKIDQIKASGDDFANQDLVDAGAIQRTVVVFEVSGPIEALTKLLHSLQQRDGFAAVPRARIWREKADDPNATLKFSAGGVTVDEKKTEESSKSDGGGFIFGR
ncbi:MAG: hypothetical protein IT452_02055 [Planctomycetia bacterium]|nr:hypothetical protein [Planctomycetia bacterium]